MKVGIVGAGLIGCYIGGQLAASGHRVVFLGRERIGQAIEANGLTVSDVRNNRRVVNRDNYAFVYGAADMLRVEPELDVVIITVKSIDTTETAQSLHDVPKSTVIVSFQNGVSNAAAIRAVLPDHAVVPAMVPFNVMQTEPGHFHQATSGDCYIEDCPAAAALHAALNGAGIATQKHADMQAVLYGKLLVNLNNAVSGIAGIPLRQQMANRLYRKCIALCQWEALAVFERAGIHAHAFVPSPPWMLPYILNLPDFLFSIIAAAVLAIDETAFSSMYDDLDRRRKTEIDYLQGEIVRLGEQYGVPTPCCKEIIAIIRQAEADNNGSPRISAPDLLARLTAAKERQQ